MNHSRRKRSRKYCWERTKESIEEWKHIKTLWLAIGNNISEHVYKVKVTRVIRIREMKCNMVLYVYLYD